MGEHADLLVVGLDVTNAALTKVSAPTPDDDPYGPFSVKQRDRHVHSSEQAITELF